MTYNLLASLVMHSLESKPSC